MLQWTKDVTTVLSDWKTSREESRAYVASLLLRSMEKTVERSDWAAIVIFSRSLRRVTQTSHIKPVLNWWQSSITVCRSLFLDLFISSRYLPLWSLFCNLFTNLLDCWCSSCDIHLWENWNSQPQGLAVSLFWNVLPVGVMSLTSNLSLFSAPNSPFSACINCHIYLCRFDICLKQVFSLFSTILACYHPHAPPCQVS